MSDTNFTPGPWIRDKWGKVRDSNGDTIRLGGFALASGYVPSGDVSDFNDSLCAAAPDLYGELALLVRLLEQLEQSGSLNVPGLATLNGPRAALAKARGEAGR